MELEMNCDSAYKPNSDEDHIEYLSKAMQREQDDIIEMCMSEKHNCPTQTIHFIIFSTLEKKLKMRVSQLAYSIPIVTCPFCGYSINKDV